MCHFWKHLRQATWSDDGRVLQLAEGTHFLGVEEYGDKIMLRDCYSDFEGMINDHFADTGKGFAVIGNPGKLQPRIVPLRHLVGSHIAWMTLS
jgi:hypothetical protein